MINGINAMTFLTYKIPQLNQSIFRISSNEYLFNLAKRHIIFTRYNDALAEEEKRLGEIEGFAYGHDSLIDDCRQALARLDPMRPAEGWNPIVWEIASENLLDGPRMPFVEENILKFYRDNLNDKQRSKIDKALKEQGKSILDFALTLGKVRLRYENAAFLCAIGAYSMLKDDESVGVGQEILDSIDKFLAFEKLFYLEVNKALKAD